MTDDLEDIVAGSDEDEQTMTAAEVLAKVEELWVTELLSPTLECHQIELVDCLIDQMDQMNTNLQKCKKTDFRLSIHKMELERIRYVVSSYLRCRLKKIERFAHYLLEKHEQPTDEKLELLSPQELQFAKQFKGSMEEHFNCLALQHMPECLRDFSTAKMSVKPNLDAYVFLKSKRNIPGVLIQDSTGEGRDEEVDLEEGGQHLLTYKSVENLIQTGAVALI